MRPLLFVLGLLPTALPAQSADTALVYRILVAEERRDSTDPALAAGRASDDARVRLLAVRALGRIRDPRFALRDSLPPAAPPRRTWPEPSWKAQFRELSATTSCARLAELLGSDVGAVRWHAASRVTAACAGTAVRPQLERLRARRPSGPLQRDAYSGPGAMQRYMRDRQQDATAGRDAAEGLEALARLDAAAARPEIVVAAGSTSWQLRRSAARAAATVADTATLLRLLRDVDGNVQEAAVEALTGLAPHAHDAALLTVLARSTHPQAVRAAAVALKGTTLTQVSSTAAKAYATRWRRSHDSERDVRDALRALAPSERLDEPPAAVRPPLPVEAAALALGAERRIRVELGAFRAFTVRVRGDLAPIMAARILARVRSGAYDGTTWHRVEHDFVIQGGSPGANEYVGDAVYLRDELGTLAHPRGTVGMSTRGHDTGDAQWFVNLRDNARLRGDYTVWAEVTEGMDVVDGVLEGDRIVRMRVVP